TSITDNYTLSLHDALPILKASLISISLSSISPSLISYRLRNPMDFSYISLMAFCSFLISAIEFPETCDFSAAQNANSATRSCLVTSGAIGMRTNLLDGRSTSSSECASLNTLTKEGVRSGRTSFQNPLKTEATAFSEIIREAIALSEYGQRTNFLSTHPLDSMLPSYGFSNVFLHLPKRMKSQ